jgi:hypothetical protein
MDLLCFLLMIGTMVLIIKKHVAGLNIIWKLLAVMPLLIFIQPILWAAVSTPAGMKRSTGNQVPGLPSPIFPPPSLIVVPPLLHRHFFPAVTFPFSRSSFTPWPRKTMFALVPRPWYSRTQSSI